MPVETRPQAVARTTSVLASAAWAIRSACVSDRPVHRRGGERLEADEHLRQAGGVEPGGELVDIRRRRREHRADGPDHERSLGLGGHLGDRSGGQQPTDEPHDEEPLGEAGQRASEPVEPAQDALVETPADRRAEARADGLADPDREEQGDEHADRPQRGVDTGQEVVEERQRQDDDDAPGGGAGQAEQLGEEAGAPARDQPEREEDDDPDVDEVHRASIGDDGRSRPRA